MSIINYASREIQFKIVYYGPALCGKTTNLVQVHDQTQQVQVERAEVERQDGAPVARREVLDRCRERRTAGYAGTGDGAGKGQDPVDD